MFDFIFLIQKKKKKDDHHHPLSINLKQEKNDYFYLIKVQIYLTTAKRDMPLNLIICTREKKRDKTH